MNFNVSVIIPVYNAENFLKKAVESAIHLEEVGEVILIEDKSPDNALQICRELERLYDKVKLYQHPDKGNHGAGASRNLGIEKAQCNYIAFLDADDYYLPNRFIKDKEKLTSNPKIDGVYNAIGIHYYSPEAKQLFIKAGFEYQEFLTLSQEVPPNELFFVLFHTHPHVKGDFSTDTITVRKNVFEKVGLFNTHLRLGQDTHLWSRMAAVVNLTAGQIIEPVAIRGVHENNRMTNQEDQILYQEIWWKDLKNWISTNNIKSEYKRSFNKAYLNFKILNGKRSFNVYKEFWIFFMTNPSEILKMYGSFDFLFWKLYGKNFFTLHLISAKNRFFKLLK